MCRRKCTRHFIQTTKLYRLSLVKSVSVDCNNSSILPSVEQKKLCDGNEQCVRGWWWWWWKRHSTKTIFVCEHFHSLWKMHHCYYLWQHFSTQHLLGYSSNNQWACRSFRNTIFLISHSYELLWTKNNNTKREHSELHLIASYTFGC